MKDEMMPNPYAASTTKRVYAKTTTPEPTLVVEESIESVFSAVPDGTAKETLEWVGEDVDRALAAIEAEEGRDKPRKVLLSDLEKIVNG